MIEPFSPKSSAANVSPRPHNPLGGRSPNVALPQGIPLQRGSAIGGSNADIASLKLTISIKQKTPFYLTCPEQPPINETTGANNLMAARGLEHSYMKLSTKKMKDSLSSFLSHLPGIIDTPGSHDNSSLRGIIVKPPVGGKELLPLNQLQLTGFRLHPGPLPEQYRGLAFAMTRKKLKHKKHKHNKSLMDTNAAVTNTEEKVEEEKERKREKKHKKHDKDTDDRKRRKKEKKKKRNKEDKD